MQTLDIISVNLWHILISLANLALIFWIVKKFLFGPIRNMLDARQADIDHRYAAADEAKRAAEEDRRAWDEKMQGADERAASIIKEATDTAVTDERNRFIRGKAWSWVGYLYIIIAAVATIVFKLLGQETLMFAASGSVCLMLVLYWIIYLILNKKY